MTIYSKYNVSYRLQKWMDSVPGQTFLNYAYSWGAAIVILGTLFKLTHLKGADFFLFLGMGTEVLVFFLSAFDRPFDKTTDGMVAMVAPSSLMATVVPILAHRPSHRRHPAPSLQLFSRQLQSSRHLFRLIPSWMLLHLPT